MTVTVPSTFLGGAAVGSGGLVASGGFVGSTAGGFVGSTAGGLVGSGAGVVVFAQAATKLVAARAPESFNISRREIRFVDIWFILLKYLDIELK